VHGNALGFVDWLVLWTLIYVIGFQSLGMRKLSPALGT
jgi:AAT family amino acid transporter